MPISFICACFFINYSKDFSPLKQMSVTQSITICFLFLRNYVNCWWLFPSALYSPRQMNAPRNHTQLVLRKPFMSSHGLLWKEGGMHCIAMKLLTNKDTAHSMMLLLHIVFNVQLRCKKYLLLLFISKVKLV